MSASLKQSSSCEKLKEKLAERFHHVSCSFLIRVGYNRVK
jgi:hypothetical protein